LRQISNFFGREKKACLWLFFKINPLKKKRKKENHSNNDVHTSAYKKRNPGWSGHPFQISLSQTQRARLPLKNSFIFRVRTPLMCHQQHLYESAKKGVGWAARWKQLYEQTISRYEKKKRVKQEKILSKVFSWQFRFPSNPVKRKLT
jgi:hypothetical protein